MDNCTAAVERDYMFYLSFENSLCDQYVTEKLWRWLKKAWLPDGYCPIFRLYEFGPSGLKDYGSARLH